MFIQKSVTHLTLCAYITTYFGYGNIPNRSTHNSDDKSHSKQRNASGEIQKDITVNFISYFRLPLLKAQTTLARILYFD